MKTKKSLIVVLILSGIAVALVQFGPAMAEEIAYAVQRGKVTADREQLAELAKQDRMSPLFEAVSRTVKPSVVVVNVRQKVALPQTMGADPFRNEFFRRHFGEAIPQPRQDEGERFQMRRGQGSGVIVDAENGYVLTNYHVAGDADEVEIVTHDDRTFEAEWVRGDEKTDLAVVKIKPDNLIASPLGDSDQVEVGQWVLAVGAPLSLPQTVTAGIISAKGRWTDPRMYQSYLQTDAAINRGNSGGPLVNTRGEVIGINTAILSNTGMNAGIGMAIPSNMARDIMSQLIDNGKVTRGFLGVRIQNVDSDLASSFKLPNANGALVTEVVPDGPADKAGLKSEDFITRLDGKAVEDVHSLRNITARIRPGKAVKVEIVRDGKPKTLKLTIGALDEAELASAESTDKAPAKAARYGVTTQDLTNELAKRLGYDSGTKGALIAEVRRNSQAAEAGLSAGLLIVQADGKRIESAKQFQEVLDEANGRKVRLKLTNARGGKWYVVLEAEDD